MSNATVTPAAVNAQRAAAIGVEAGTPASVSALRDALAAVTAGKHGVEGATATLAAAVLDRFNVHAANHVRTLDGVRVVLDSSRKDIARAVWGDAGHGDIPAANVRNAGDKSLAQYLSRFSTVATDEHNGVDFLVDVETAFAAYDAIRDERSDRAAAAADRAFTVWVTTLLPADQKAVTRTIEIMGREGAKAHRAAFVRTFTPAD